MNNSPWINNIPKEWKCEKAKYHFRYSKNKNTDSDVNLLSLTLNGVIENSLENPNGMLPSDISTYQKVKRNSLIFKLIDLENIKTSRVGICPKDGIMSSAYIHLETSENARYMYYQYFNMYNNLVFNKLGSGVRSTLNYTDLLNMDMLIPNVKEQNKIANFLDEKVTKIDKNLKQERKKLLTLKEVKYKVLNEIIEEHCKSYGNEIDVSLGYIARLGSGTTPDSRTKNYYAENNIDGFHWLQTGDLTNAEVFTTKKYITESARIKNGLKLYSSGSLVIAMYGATIGKLGIPQFNFTCNQACCVVIPRQNVNKYYLKYYLEINSQKLVKMSVGGGQPNISQQILKKFKIKLPPLNNQNEIVKSIEVKLNKFNNLEETSLKYISKLEEYKKVLINDAVTGKIKIGDEYAK